MSGKYTLSKGQVHWARESEGTWKAKYGLATLRVHSEIDAPFFLKDRPQKFLGTCDFDWAGGWPEFAMTLDEAKELAWQQLIKFFNHFEPFIVPVESDLKEK